MTTIKAAMLKLEPYELNTATHFVGIEEMQAWMIMMKVHNSQTW